jgi:hypothetical protein
MVSEREKAQAKRIIAAIVCEYGGTLYGTTRLYKAFYHAHLIHWETQQGVLTSYPIVHMPRGPGIDRWPSLLEELKEEGVISTSVRIKGSYREDVYILDPSKAPTGLTEGELSSIRSAVQFVGGRDTPELSNESHDNAWNRATSGEELNIYLDTLSELEYAQMQERQLRIRQLLE